MSVESIEWSGDGEILLASVRQGFIVVCSFGKDGFGKKLSDSEKDAYSTSNFGMTANQNKFEFSTYTTLVHKELQ